MRLFGLIALPNVSPLVEITIKPLSGSGSQEIIASPVG